MSQMSERLARRAVSTTPSMSYIGADVTKALRCITVALHAWFAGLAIQKLGPLLPVRLRLSGGVCCHLATMIERGASEGLCRTSR